MCMQQAIYIFNLISSAWLVVANPKKTSIAFQHFMHVYICMCMCSKLDIRMTHLVFVKADVDSIDCTVKSNTNLDL